jgi:hypothetical protein
MTSYAFESATPNENDDHDLCHLGTISKLQSKLEDAKLKSSKIEKENQTLHQEQEKLRNALSNVESRYNETKKSLFKMMDNVSSRERELNIVETRWRVLVDKERNEVESARKEYLNQVQQLQNMRSQIRQEVEKEYVEQVELLTKEVRCGGSGSDGSDGSAGTNGIYCGLNHLLTFLIRPYFYLFHFSCLFFGK